MLYEFADCWVSSIPNQWLGTPTMSYCLRQHKQPGSFEFAWTNPNGIWTATSKWTWSTNWTLPRKGGCTTIMAPKKYRLIRKPFNSWLVKCRENMIVVYVRTYLPSLAIWRKHWAIIGARLIYKIQSMSAWHHKISSPPMRYDFANSNKNWEIGSQVVKTW